ncbi:hypothetical protein [Shewanella sp. GXUN23E]|uniref:hypothetical protein n=1 Tax=Shewanella sp. GXUN23E TaxID=3422498 RepID=UPI003D7E4670
MKVNVAPNVAISGGCYWCMQAVLDVLPGMIATQIGWFYQDHQRIEVAAGYWDCSQLALESLLQIHLLLFCQGTDHALRPRYPRAIWFGSESSGHQARAWLDEQHIDARPDVNPLADLIPAPERYQHLFCRHPQLPFCQRIIAPKLTVLDREFGYLLNR